MRRAVLVLALAGCGELSMEGAATLDKRCPGVVSAGDNGVVATMTCAVDVRRQADPAVLAVQGLGATLLNTMRNRAAQARDQQARSAEGSVRAEDYRAPRHTAAGLASQIQGATPKMVREALRKMARDPAAPEPVVVETPSGRFRVNESGAR